MPNRNPPSWGADRNGERNSDPERRDVRDDLGDRTADFLQPETHSDNYWPSHNDEDHDHWPLQYDDRDGWQRSFERPRAYIAYDRPHPYGFDNDARDRAPAARRAPYEWQRQRAPYVPSRDVSGSRSALDSRFERQWDPRFAPFQRERGPAPHARGPKGYTRSDERIREDVNDRLSQLWESDVSDVEVSVAGGEVTLMGSVRSRSTKFRVENIADAISGVTEVHNHLRVRPEGVQLEYDAAQSPPADEPSQTAAPHTAPRR